MLSEIIGKWGCSIDDDNWSSDSWFDTKQEAITSGKVDYNEFFVGRVVAPTVSIDTVRLLDIVSENVYEEYGEHADDYLNGIESSVTNELDKKLNEVFQNWLTKHELHPTFYRIEDVEEITK